MLRLPAQQDFRYNRRHFIFVSGVRDCQKSFPQPRIIEKSPTIPAKQRDDFFSVWFARNFPRGQTKHNRWRWRASTRRDQLLYEAAKNGFSQHRIIEQLVTASL